MDGALERMVEEAAAAAATLPLLLAAGVLMLAIACRCSSNFTLLAFWGDKGGQGLRPSSLDCNVACTHVWPLRHVLIVITDGAKG